MDIQAWPTTSPVAEDKEENPGVAIASCGMKVLVQPAGVTTTNGAVLYSRKVTWDKADKVIVEKMNGTQWTTTSSPIDLSGTDEEVELRVRPTTQMTATDALTMKLEVAGNGSTFKDQISLLGAKATLTHGPVHPAPPGGQGRQSSPAAIGQRMIMWLGVDLLPASLHDRCKADGDLTWTWSIAKIEYKATKMGRGTPHLIISSSSFFFAAFRGRQGSRNVDSRP